eukprot:TRINITY_DN9786_c0_g1_i1.p1 TRINITY_DN9786_c0_g1~~TRINITY_DN9786_c0_g1_i1.p1  ORF type:complete len:676 (+),score=137.06 TRINITY_DN9786_c0_g1_i1:73-2028(+)
MAASLPAAGRRSPLQCIVDRALRDSDSPEERSRKQIWIPVTLVLVVLAPFWTFTMQEREQYRYRAAWYGAVLIAATSLVSLLYPLIMRSLPVIFVGNCCISYTVGCLLMDWSLAAGEVAMRTWTSVVLVMDVLLALHVPRSFQWGVLVMVTVHIVYINTEAAFRLGLFDIPHWTDQKLEWREQCADPPCALGLSQGLVIALAMMLIFHIDFFMTRSFAESSRREQAAMAASITVADQVAADLARFDLNAAELVLAGASLPPRLMSSFHQLLDNLSSYRPYLPESCFHFDKRDQPSASSSSSSSSGRGGRIGSTFSGETSPRHSLRRQTSGRSPHSSMASTPDGRTPCNPSLVREAHAAQQRNVTILHCNQCDFLAYCARVDVGSVRDRVALEVDRFTATVRSLGGTSDLLSADHLSASFGAVKAQGSHRNSATRAAWALARPADPAADAAPTAAACSGRALCGDFGSVAAQRFMVIGGVSSFAVAAERAAAAWGIGALIDTAVHSDAEQFWSCRLRKMVSFPKLQRGSLVGLWEVVAERLPQGGEPDEWMYQLDRAEPNPWAPYNAVLQKWYDGTAPEALVAVHSSVRAPAHSSDKEDPGAAAPGLQVLLGHIRSIGRAPACDFTPRGLCGDPAPVEQGAHSADDVESVTS